MNFRCELKSPLLLDCAFVDFSAPHSSLNLADVKPEYDWSSYEERPFYMVGLFLAMPN
jgi:hypothetical protein